MPAAAASTASSIAPMTPELTEPDAIERYIVPPGLGDSSGVIGAIELALDAP